MTGYDLIEDNTYEDNFKDIQDDPSWWYEAHYWHTIQAMASLIITYGEFQVLNDLAKTVNQKLTDINMSESH